MHRFIPLLCIATIVLSCPQCVFAQDREQAITVYSNGLGLVRDMRTIELPRGRSTVTIPQVAAEIDPTSVRIQSLTAPEELSILEQRYTYDIVTGNLILAGYLNQDIQLIIGDSDIPVTGRLLHADRDQLTLQLEDGRVEIIRREVIQRISLPALPEDLVTTPTLTWLLDNNRKAGMHRLEITYLTGGLTWHAEYTALMNETNTEMTLSGWATIDNRSGATYDNASITLVAGDPNRVSSPQPMMARKSMMQLERANAAPQFNEQNLFEYHTYTLDRRATIVDKASVQLTLFKDTTGNISKQYVYDGMMAPQGVQTRIRFQNKENMGFGKPIPRGTIRLYQQDAQGKPQFVGEDRVKDLARDETVYLTVGRAFDLAGERIQTNSHALSKRSREEQIRIVLRNHTDEDVSIRVVEHLNNQTWSISESSNPYERLNAHTIEFNVPVQTDGEVEVTYTVVYRW